MSEQDERTRSMLLEIDADEDAVLSEWELGFVASLIDRDQRAFTYKQRATIERIYKDRI